MPRKTHVSQFRKTCPKCGEIVAYGRSMKETQLNYDLNYPNHLKHKHFGDYIGMLNDGYIKNLRGDW